MCFPDPEDPKIFSHLPGQVGQLSINLKAEKLLLDTKKSCSKYFFAKGNLKVN